PVDVGDVEALAVVADDGVRLVQQGVEAGGHAILPAVPLGVEDAVCVTDELGGVAEHPARLDDLVQADILLEQAPDVGRGRAGLDVEDEELHSRALKVSAVSSAMAFFSASERRATCVIWAATLSARSWICAGS